MKRYVFQFPVDLPGGNYCVVTAEVPATAKGAYFNHVPKRTFWTSKKLFKRKHNADKYMQRIFKEQRNHNLMESLITKGLYSLN